MRWRSWVGVEAGLVANLAGMRRAAEQETQVRQTHGRPVPGPYGEAYRAARQLLGVVSDAREALPT